MINVDILYYMLPNVPSTSSSCVKYVLKTFQTKIMKNGIFKNCSWKKGFSLHEKGTFV